MKYSLEGISVQIEGEVFIAPTATLIGNVLLKDKSSVWWGAVLRGDYERITVGERTNIQDNCIVHMDADYPVTLGNQVTVGHKAVLHGCTIGNNALIGINSVIMNDVVVGDDCLIGSNTLLTEGKQIPPRSLVVGSPGKIIRELNDEEVAEITEFSDRYVRNSKRYRETLQPQG